MLQKKITIESKYLHDTERHIRIIIPSGPLIQLNTFQPVNLVMHDGNMYITDFATITKYGF